MNTVPIILDDVYKGFANGQGLLRHEDDHICLEFQISDAVVGLIKSAIKEIRIPIRDLVSVTLVKSWFPFRTNIVIQAKRLEVLREVPTAESGQVRLGIARKDRPAAERFVADLHVIEEVKG